ncbi:MAG: lysylphosphatidylglycerol synthase transmembrane domain-containing protein [Nitrospirota bacterium]
MALKANNAALLILKICISSGLLYLVLSRTGLDRVFLVMRNLSPAAFFSAIVLYLSAQFISTMRWKLLLPGEMRMRNLFSLYMIGSFFNTFLPGLIGGDAVKGYYLYQATGKGTLAVASVFMDRYLGLFVMIVISALAFPFGYPYFQGSRIVWLLPAAVLSFFIASGLIFGLRLGNRIPMLSAFYASFHAYRNQKNTMLNALLLSGGVQFANFLAVYVIALGMGQHVPFLSLLVFLPLVVLFTMLPISISGLGVREGAFVLFFGLIGITAEAAAAISLSWFLTMVAGNLLGLLEYIRYKKEGLQVHGNERES